MQKANRDEHGLLCCCKLTSMVNQTYAGVSHKWQGCMACEAHGRQHMGVGCQTGTCTALAGHGAGIQRCSADGCTSRDAKVPGARLSHGRLLHPETAPHTLHPSAGVDTGVLVLGCTCNIAFCYAHPRSQAEVQTTCATLCPAGLACRLRSGSSSHVVVQLPSLHLHHASA